MWLLIAWLDLLTISKDVKVGAREVRIVTTHAKIGNTFHTRRMGKEIRAVFLEASEGRSTMDEGFIKCEHSSCLQYTQFL